MPRKKTVEPQETPIELTPEEETAILAQAAPDSSAALLLPEEMAGSGDTEGSQEQEASMDEIPLNPIREDTPDVEAALEDALRLDAVDDVEQADLTAAVSEAPIVEPGSFESEAVKEKKPVDPDVKAPAPRPKRKNRVAVPELDSCDPRILPLVAREQVASPMERNAVLWHEIQNANMTHRLLTGNLEGVEVNEREVGRAIINYKGLRIVIPASEFVHPLLPKEDETQLDLEKRYVRLMNNMLGAEVDFQLKGIDSTTLSAVASRISALTRKKRLFYFSRDDNPPMVREDRIVQARVIAVAESALRVEIFGVETTIHADNVSWDWIGNLRERYNTGDRVLVRILRVTINSPTDIQVRADMKSVTNNDTLRNLEHCKPQGKYMGEVTRVNKGVIYIHLRTGVNAIAHSCYDARMPGKGDEVCFVVTKIDREQNVAVGLISRIIRQKL